MGGICFVFQLETLATMNNTSIDLNAVCDKLKIRKCPAHGQTPQVYLMQNRVQMKTCCDTFHQILEAVVINETAKRIDDNIIRKKSTL